MCIVLHKLWFPLAVVVLNTASFPAALCGLFLLTAVIGLLHPVFDKILGESQKQTEQEWANVMKIIAVFIGINYASAVSFIPTSYTCVCFLLFMSWVVNVKNGGVGNAHTQLQSLFHYFLGLQFFTFLFLFVLINFLLAIDCSFILTLSDHPYGSASLMFHGYGCSFTSWLGSLSGFLPQSTDFFVLQFGIVQLQREKTFRFSWGPTSPLPPHITRDLQNRGGPESSKLLIFYFYSTCGSSLPNLGSSSRWASQASERVVKCNA